MSWTGFGHRGGRGGFRPDLHRGQQNLDGQSNQSNQALHPTDRSGSTTPCPSDYNVCLIEDKSVPAPASSPHRLTPRSPRPPPPTSSIVGRANVEPRRQFSVTSQKSLSYHPDDLINGIPEHQKSVADFNWNSPHQFPYRNIPSALLAAMTEPKSRTHGEPGPNWRALLSYYSGPNATEGLMNLQDLYLYVTRVGIPNAVIDNRRLLLHFYLNKPRAPVAIKLRYDRWPGTCEPQQEVYIPPTSAPQASPPNTVPVHSIFRDYPTPSGASFAQWLHNPMNVPPGTVLLVQMQHRGSVLDGYLNEDEVAVRQIAGPALIDRTVRVLKLYWWLWMANRWLVEYQDGGWAGMEREVL